MGKTVFPSDVLMIFIQFKRINLVSRSNVKSIAALKEILTPKQVTSFGNLKI